MPVQVRPAVPEAASGDNRPFFGRFFYAKKTARRKALCRGFIAFQASCLLCGLYSPRPFPPFSFAFIKNASPEQAPPSAPISAVGSISAPSAKEVKAPTTAPTRAGAMMITITVIIMMSTIQIFFMTLPFKRYLHSRLRATFAL